MPGEGVAVYSELLVLGANSDEFLILAFGSILLGVDVEVWGSTAAGLQLFGAEAAVVEHPPAGAFGGNIRVLSIYKLESPGEIFALEIPWLANIAFGDNLGLAFGDNLGLAFGDNLGLAFGDNLGLTFGDNLGLTFGDNLGLADGGNLTEVEDDLICKTFVSYIISR